MTRRSPDLKKTARETSGSLQAGSVVALQQQANEPTWSSKNRGASRVISAIVILHLSALLAEPIRFFTRSANGRPSPAVEPIRQLLAPYVEFAYLSHGYFFFAPNPGPSHLMEFRLVSGQSERRLRLPNHRVQVPRLLYHRHFMLAEFLNNLFVPSVPPVEAPSGSPPRMDWERGRRTYDMIRSSMCRHVSTRFGAESVDVRRIEHRLPSDTEVFHEKWALDDERLYVLLAESPLAAPETPDPSMPGSRMLGPQMPGPGVGLLGPVTGTPHATGETGIGLFPEAVQLSGEQGQR